MHRYPFSDRLYNKSNSISHHLCINKQTKLKKIEYFYNEEQHLIGFLLGHLHITFILEYGQDDDGEYFDIAECRVLDINSGDED